MSQMTFSAEEQDFACEAGNLYSSARGTAFEDAPLGLKYMLLRLSTLGLTQHRLHRADQRDLSQLSSQLGQTHAISCQAEQDIAIGNVPCWLRLQLLLPGLIGGHKWLERTSAMASGITDHCWTVHELLSFKVPLPRWKPTMPRGRPTNALKAKIARWCK